MLALTPPVMTAAPDKLVVSAKQLMRMIDRNPQSIKDVQFVAPKLGDKHFGKFVIEIAE
jgi:hypothetical protein